MSDEKTIAVLGTGIMGAPIARRLAAAVHRVTVWNRSHDKAARLADEAPVDLADTPGAAAERAETVIVMLSDGPACDALLFGDDGVLSIMRPDSTLIVMSSISVDTAERQAEAARRLGIAYLDAPVSGGEKGAVDGSLAIMVGGEAAAFERARALFDVLGRAVHVGPAGSGQLTKLANQLIVANGIAAIAEALLLAERGGADLERVLEALQGGFADSAILRIHGRRMLEHDHAPGGPARWQYKDTQTALRQMERLALELPVSRLVDGLFHDLIEHGDGALDHSALIRELKRRNRLPMD